MDSNKIIDRIFKKLIKSDFTKDEIWSFINLKDQFSCFENYLYYIMIIGQKKHTDTIFSMAQVVNQYMITLVERYNIKNNLTVNNITKNQTITDIELFLIGVKGYGSNNNFYFDNENNLYICTDIVKHNEYNGIYTFKFNNYCEGFLKSKTNMKILKRKINKILIFSKANGVNIFKGFYKLYRFNHFYLDSQQLYGFTVIPEDDFDENLLIQFSNIQERNCIDSLNKLKTELTEIVSQSRTDCFNFLNLISMSENHITLIYQTIHHGLISHNKYIINEIKRKYNEMIELNFSILSLVPNHSVISEYHLTILANCIDILYGKRINSNYQNNVFICFNKSSMNFEDDDRVSLRFIKSFYNRYFDVDENKKIFNTSVEPTCIYLFQGDSANNYLFLGFYKVVKVYIDYDLQNNKTPVFLLRKLNDDEMINHINYLIENKSTNVYKNHFKNFSNASTFPSEWLHDKVIIENKIEDNNNDLLNSLCLKYNWIIHKTLTNYNNSKIDKYFKNFVEFDNRIINWIFKTLSHDFKYLIENNLMHPSTIAYEMTKCNWGSKELFDISYPDHYFTKKAKFDIMLNIIDSKDK